MASSEIGEIYAHRDTLPTKYRNIPYAGHKIDKALSKDMKHAISKEVTIFGEPIPEPTSAPAPSHTSSFYGTMGAIGSALTAAVTYGLPQIGQTLNQLSSDIVNFENIGFDIVEQASDLQYETFTEFLEQARRLLTDEFGPYVADLVLETLNPAQTYTIADLARLGHETLQTLRAAGISSRGRILRPNELPRWR